MEDKTIEIRRNVVITGEDIDEIMACALDAGISYWCKEAEVEGGYLGEYASDQISRGGTLILKPYDDEPKKINLESVVNGILLYCTGNCKPYDILKMDEHGCMRIDQFQIDAIVGDMIVQYAAFGEVAYG